MRNFVITIDNFTIQTPFTQNLFLGNILPVPVAARSKALVCGRSPAEIVGSNPTGGIDMSVVSVVGCQVEVSATS